MCAVKIDNLWSTPVLTQQFSVADVPPIPTGQQEPVVMVPGMQHVKQLVESAATQLISTIDRIPMIVSSWMTEGNTRKGHDLHVDTHQGGTHVAIMWIAGDVGVGGDLELWDPRWINPRLTGGKYTDSKHVIKFQPGTLIMFPASVWHSVTQYTGSTVRRSLNMVITAENVRDIAIEQQLVEELTLLSESLGVQYDGSLSSALSVLRAQNARRLNK